MQTWMTWSVLAIALIGGAFCLVRGLAGKIPNDLTLAAGAFTTIGLMIQLPMSIIAPLTSNAPEGDLVEYWMYHITAILIIVAAVFWSLVERNRWSTIILGLACFSVAIMFWRMNVIWTIPEIPLS
ncbi:MAG: hypothetical protein WBA28_04125 [Microbacteriaceae bacterium]